jgi:hypothetical protein
MSHGTGFPLSSWAAISSATDFSRSPSAVSDATRRRNIFSDSGIVVRVPSVCRQGIRESLGVELLDCFLDPWRKALKLDEVLSAFERWSPIAREPDTDRIVHERLSRVFPEFEFDLN